MAETFRLTEMFPCGSGHKMCFRDTNPLFKCKISSCYNAGDYSIVNNNCHILKDRTLDRKWSLQLSNYYRTFISLTQPKKNKTLLIISPNMMA